MPSDDRVPVIVATGQTVEREETVWAVDLATRASQAALDQAPLLRDRIGRVSIVNILSGGGSSPAGNLARSLGLSSPKTEVSTVGGNSPQWLVNRAAEAIAAGEEEAVLIAGAESQRSRMRTQAAGSTRTGIQRERTGDLSEEKLEPDPIVGDQRPGAGPAELGAGLILPVHFYAMFESVIAHRRGRGYAEHRRDLGELMAPFTEVASKNPYAWFPQARTAIELSEIGPDNRLVSEPYPKRMCAVMGVDQAAAVIVTSLEAARTAGVEERAIFCWSGADACDVWFPSERPDLGRSPGIAAASSAALNAAAIGIDDVSSIDLYSCFPCVVEMAVEALGLTEDDERGFTVTGGLAYFGGPGNNYTLHSIAAMVDTLRERMGTGLVSGLGWYATKHSFGVYSSGPSPHGWRRGDTEQSQKEIDASAVEVADVSEAVSDGPLTATVLASTVASGRDGELTAAPVIAQLEDGRHVVVAVEDSEIASSAGRNLVGGKVVVSGSPARYRVAS